MKRISYLQYHFQFLSLIFLFSILGCNHLQRSEKSGYKHSSHLDSGPVLSESQLLTKLELSIPSKRELVQYNKILPQFESSQEKIEFLSLANFEEKQIWIRESDILNRNKSAPSEVASIIEQNDISVGMTEEWVKQSWGDPDKVEFAGNPVFRNIRWKYIKQIPTPLGYKQETKLVYFEGGKVVGWESDLN
jgi:hypothetical protein